MTTAPCYDATLIAHSYDIKTMLTHVSNIVNPHSDGLGWIYFLPSTKGLILACPDTLGRILRMRMHALAK